MLVGRDHELGELRRLVRAVHEGQGGALLLHGEAGIGKTALLDAAREAAGDAMVLECHGIESESSLPFGALRDLVWAVVDRREELPGPQQAALAGALALGPAVPGDRLAVCVATLGVLEAAARHRPVVVLIDDLQWLDDPSSECIAYVARRARGPLALALTARSGDGNGGWPGIPSIEVGPLGETAATELIAGAAPDLAADVRAAVTAAADGNPLALVELPATLTAAQRRGTTPLERPLAPGRGFERLYAERLAELPRATRKALLVAAACHTDELAPLAAAFRVQGLPIEALEAAEAAGLVAVTAKRLRFSHPLVRGGVYHGASASDRRAAHRALAAGDAGEARAWHLGAAALGPDEDAATALEQVAGIAAARRAYAVAAEALERAAELTADPAVAVGRLLGAGAAALSAGRTANALALADEACERAIDPLARAAAEHLRGVLKLWSGQIVDAIQVLERSADAAAANPPMAALILADASFGCSAAGDCPRALVLAERAGALVGEDTEPAVRAPVLASLAWALILRGETDRARPLMSEVLGLAASLDPFSPAAQLMLMTLNCRVPFEDYEGALADALERAAAAREAGSLYALPTPLCVAGAAAIRLGRWNDVEEMCGEALAAAEETGQSGPAALARITRARVTAAQGKEAEARADADAALALSESAGLRCFETYGHGVLGFLELSAGRIDAAIAELEETEREVAETGLEEPTIVPWAPDLIEAYMRAGRAEPARRVLATLVRQAEQADTSGTAALVERCRGLVADRDFDDHFQRALTHHDASAMPFERARTLLAWGMRLHRARRRAEARERLRESAALFDALPASTWADVARAELRAAGGRRTRHASAEGLSAQEERVARAAGRGATTREIAAELFLSPKTVEFHLGRAYRKLGVRSRAALSTALSERDQRDDATAALSN